MDDDRHGGETMEAKPEDMARPKHGDCYSAGERQAMEWTQQLRARWLAPVLRLATRWGATADHVTLASLAAGLAFAPLYLARGSHPWCLPGAFLALALHVLLDGIDGPLARHQQVASRAGSFTDTCSDQIVVTATTLALTTGEPPALAPLLAGTYVFLYTMVVAFAMVRNALDVPYSWLVRPRFWVYGWIVVDSYVLPQTLDWVVAAFSLLLLVKLITGFRAIRRML